MTQEIFDYLLIRSYFANNSEKDIDELDFELEYYKSFLKNISMVMQKEDYFLLCDELCNRVSYFIQRNRFKFNYDKEANVEMNFIIQRLNEYKRLSENEKIKRAEAFIKEEYESRKMPNKYRVSEELPLYISRDCSYFMEILGLEYNGDSTISSNPNHNFEIDNYFEYLSLINWLIDKYPDFVLNTALPEQVKLTTDTICSIKKMPSYFKEYSKITAKNLKKLEKSYVKKMEYKNI